MFGPGILIDWKAAKEYIQLDMDAVPDIKPNPIEITYEWWPDERRFVNYNVISEVNHLANGKVELILDYRQDFNPDIGSSGVWWGISTITINPDNKDTGSAYWSDRNDSAQSGRAKWKRIDGSLFKEKKRLSATQLERQQADFRAALMACDKRCVVTGETMPEVLEAAHIIPSKDKGDEVVRNGILLRADIHRLFDSGKFSIDLNGHIVIHGEVSEDYKELLDGAVLPKHTIERVGEALRHMQGLSS